MQTCDKGEDEYGRRLHIDKPMLREWREDFARTMREQGIAANATPRVIRGWNKGKVRDRIFRVQLRGRSTTVRAKVTAIATELRKTGHFAEQPIRSTLMEKRKAVVANWARAADILDHQGEVVLAGEVRYFAKHLPAVLTDMERLAAKFAQHLAATREPSRVSRTRDHDAPTR